MEDGDFVALVTGANSGVGFGVCQRLLDTFTSAASRGHITVIIATRSEAKSAGAIALLKEHIDQHELPTARVSLLSVQAELTDLASVRTVRKQLDNLNVRKLDALILNAGITGFTGLDWAAGLTSMMQNPIRALTFNKFGISEVGSMLPLKGGQKIEQQDDLRLGKVFTANVFGHYILTHSVASLLSAGSPAGHGDANSGGRVIWASSLESESAVSLFDPVADLQGLTTTHPYNYSKRLIDTLALTSSQPSTAASLSTFLPSTPRPTIHLTHPGVLQTNIEPKPQWIKFIWRLCMAFVRLLGSPWHPAGPYCAAVSAVFVALATDEELEHAEKGRRRKWGTRQDRAEHERPVWTAVTGWEVPRSHTTVDMNGDGKSPGGEEAIAFEDSGIKAWREMEKLRKQWEGRS